MIKKWANSADKVLGSASYWLYWLGAPVLVFMIAANAYEVVARYAFNKPTGFMDALLIYGNFGVIFLVLAYAWRIKAHINVDIISSKLVGKAHARLQLGILTISFIILVFLSISVWSYEIRMFKLGWRFEATTLETPIWWSNSVITAAITLFSLEVLASLVKEIRLFFSKKEPE